MESPKVSILDDPKVEWNVEDIDFDLISGRDYSVLVVDTVPEDFEGVTFIRAKCLVLVRMTETDVYRRAGALLLDQVSEDQFESWMQTWERKNVTIV